jgi:hypothetical protein
MASIKIFRNETRWMPITAEPVVWVSAEERLRELWEIARRRILEEAPQVGPQPTGGVPEPLTQQELDQEISKRFDLGTDLHRQTRQRRVELEQSSDETLLSGAEPHIVRTGARNFVVDHTQNMAAAMITAKQGTDAELTRVTGKSKSRGGGTRGLLHPGNLLLQPLEQPGQLGPSKRVVLRAQGEHNRGSRVIA